MKLSKKGEYALKALIELAIDYDKGIAVTLIHNIAEKEDIPPRYLEQILLRLKNSGILKSKRGVGGGYGLNRSPENISLGDVMRAVEGPVSSLSSFKVSSNRGDLDNVSFGLYSVIKEVDDAIIEIVDNISLKDMAQRTLDMVEERKGVLNYAI